MFEIDKGTISVIVTMWSDYVLCYLCDDSVCYCPGYIKGKALLQENIYLSIYKILYSVSTCGDCGELDSIVE